MRRVVVTGLGAVTPLGLGAHRVWSALVAGQCGIQSVLSLAPTERWHGLPSTVAGLVPWVPDGANGGVSSLSNGASTSQPLSWRASDYLDAGQQRRMALFTQYAVAAAEMALDDAGWRPTTPLEQDRTGVCLGTGIGNLDEMYSTSVGHYEKV